MIPFNEIVGHEDVVEHLRNAIRTGKVSHSYIFTGDVGAGKKTIARAFAAALECESGQPDPCMKCDSCKKAMGGGHPDIIVVQHEKPNLISVDEIRNQIVGDIDIKPFSSPYKIYIVPDAQLMNEAAQNVLLKTIEEPPKYAVILLLTTNIDVLLPTIRSRCVRLDLRIVEEKTIKEYLMDRLHLDEEEAELDASLSQGSIGRAKEAADSESFSNLTRKALSTLKKIDDMKADEITEEVNQITADRQQMLKMLEIFQFWFRDVLMFKATRELDHLFFKNETMEIRQQARKRSYGNLEKILECLDKTIVRIEANANAQLAMELLFLTIRER